jgi:catechol 2,3-dioxygenase-like lactoylglutathione lyase family enzyme
VARVNGPAAAMTSGSVTVQLSREISGDRRSGHDRPPADRALDRTKESAFEWGSAPGMVDRKINRIGGGRGVYVRDPDGIAYELFTAVP